MLVFSRSHQATTPHSPRSTNSSSPLLLVIYAYRFFLSSSYLFVVISIALSFLPFSFAYSFDCFRDDFDGIAFHSPVYARLSVVCHTF